MKTVIDKNIKYDTPRDSMISQYASELSKQYGHIVCPIGFTIRDANDDPWKVIGIWDDGCTLINTDNIIVLWPHTVVSKYFTPSAGGETRSLFSGKLFTGNEMANHIGLSKNIVGKKFDFTHTNRKHKRRKRKYQVIGYLPKNNKFRVLAYTLDEPWNRYGFPIDIVKKGLKTNKLNYNNNYNNISIT